MSEIKAEKQSLRKLVSSIKKQYSDGWKKGESELILNNLESSPIFINAKNILIYYSLPDEVQTGDFINKWYGKKNIVLPLVVGDDLILKLYEPDRIVKGYMSIIEPTPNAVTVSPSDIDLAIIPGVAFDRNCNRMGRGRGFYDRLLPSLSCKLIGIAFDFQLFDTIPVEEFDYKMDMIITSKTQNIRQV